jgi:predicted peptidase
MRTLVAVTVAAVLVAGSARAAELRNLTAPLEGGGELLYGLLVPDGYRAGVPRPLVLALHPGGQRMRYYGSAYVQAVVAPAVQGLGAIVVAPDCQWPRWTDPEAERAVMALLERIEREYAIDSRRIVVTGFSMGGGGTWFMASRHRDRFTAAIPMAAAAGDLPIDSLATMPTYVIHSRRDEVVPFAPAARLARDLGERGRPIRFEALNDPTHFDMTAYIPALRRAFDWISERW